MKTHSLIVEFAKPPISWPVVTRHRFQAKVLEFNAPGDYPLVGYFIKDETVYAAAWTENGRIVSWDTSGLMGDILLNTDTSNPDVQAAVQRAYEAGHEIWYRIKGGFDRWDKHPLTPKWSWWMCDYLPVVLVPLNEIAPAKPQIAPGHNPDGLTVEQVEISKGYRLLNPDEICSSNASVQRSNVIECWENSRNIPAWGKAQYEGCAENQTYRTKLSPAELGALRNPKPQNAPYGFASAPGTQCKVIHKTTGALAVAKFFPDGVLIDTSSSLDVFPHSITYQELLDNYTELNGDPLGIKI